MTSEDRDNPARPGDGEADLPDDDFDVPAWVGASAPASRRGGDSTPAATAARSLSRGPSAVGLDDRHAGPLYAGPEGDTVDPDDGYDEFLRFDEYDRRDYVRLPRRSRLLRRVLGGAVLLVVLALIAVAGGAWWVFRQVDPPGPAGAAIALTVPEGASTSDIADLLAGADIVSSGRLFREYVRLKGQGGDGRFQAGSYSLKVHSSMAEALAALERGPIPPATTKVTFPEGLRLGQIADRLATGVTWFDRTKIDAAVTAARSKYQPADVATPEGLLFPDTYAFEEGQTEADAVNTMLGQFERVSAQVNLEKGAAKLGYTPYQIVIIASLIEREARTPGDRGKIARVIYNRIGADMRLDIDASTLYAVGRDSGSLSEADLETDSPYNTRLYKGLPPTPIAAPGKASLEAALNPTEGDWLYYVIADVDGSHFFTRSYSEFLRAVADAERRGLL